MTDQAERLSSWLELTAAVRKLSMSARKRFAELYSANSRYTGALYEISGRNFMSPSLSLQEEVDLMRRIALEALGNDSEEDDIGGDF